MQLRVLLLSIVAVSGIALAGCAGTQGDAPTTIETVTTTPDPLTVTTTATPPSTPEKGDNLLSVMKVNSSTAMEANDSKRATFSALNQSQQEAFLRAYKCSCNVNQNVFQFNDKDRIEYVRYEGQWYYLRVTIV